MIVSDKSKYLEFVNDFFARRGGSIGDEDWFDRVDIASQDIRQIIGGTSKTFEIELKDKVSSVPLDKLQKSFKEIEALLPGMFANYGFTYEDLGFQQIPKGKLHSGTKWTKFIKHYADNLDLDKAKSDAVAKILERLGQDWAKAKNTKAKLYVTLTTDQVAYTLLGHYGCDHGSCFGQTGCNSTHKLRLGQSKNTFVITVSDFKPEDSKSLEDKALARFWAVKDGDYYHICNYYPKPKSDEGNIHSCVKQVMQEIIGSPIKIEEQVMFIRQDVVYHNQKDGTLNWTIYSENTKPINCSRFGRDLSHIISKDAISKMIKCPQCNKLASESKFVVVDGKKICSSCVANAWSCAHCLRMTASTKYTVINNTGKETDVCYSCLSHHYFMCHLDGRHHHKDSKVHYENNGATAYAAKSSVVARGYVKCSTCGTYHKNKKYCNGCQEISKRFKEVSDRHKTVIDYDKTFKVVKKVYKETLNSYDDDLNF